MLRKFCVILIAMLVSACAWAQADGAIRGTVLDQNGKPVAGVKVHLQKTDLAVVHSVPRVAETDAQGKFLFERVALGTYRLSSAKVEDGYADTFNPFYRTGTPDQVILTRAAPTQDTNVQLGAKAGVLKLASVSDAVSGKDISVSAVLTLARANTPESYMIVSATQPQILVPSSTDVVISIAVPGYKKWTLGKVGKDVPAMNVKPGETVEVQAKLVPESPNPTIAELLMELGEKNKTLFTLEEAAASGDGTNIRTYRFARPEGNPSLTAILDAMARTVPNFRYSVDAENPRIIHIVDARLAQMGEYVLGEPVDRMDFSGPVYALLRAVSDRSGPISSIQIPGPYDLLPVDLRSTVKIQGDGMTAREALSQIPAREGKGGILWQAQTEPGKRQSTVLTFCCAPRVQ